MDAAASKTLLQRELAMKITKSQLKQIIKEEQQALIKENIISDMVDKIVDSGEDFGDWIKGNAREVAKIAKKVGSGVEEFIDDAGRSYQRALHKVGTATGIELSKKQKYARIGREREQALEDEEAQRKSDYQAGLDAEEAAAQAERERIDALPWHAKPYHMRKPENRPSWDQPGDRQGPPREEEEESEYSRRQRALGKGGPGYFQSDHSPWRESINRDKLARIVAEELQKVLKDR